MEPILAGPLVGEVGTSDAHVWARGASELPLKLSLFDGDGTEVTALTSMPKGKDGFCVVFHVLALENDTRYEYEISSAVGKTDRYSFRTAPTAAKRKAVVVFGSCLQDPETSSAVFSHMRMIDPDLLLMIGDNAYYSNEEVSEDLSATTVENNMMKTQLRYRKAHGLRGLSARVPTLAIWDDHDFGPNNSGRKYKHREVALRCFRRMWANRRYGIASKEEGEDVPGVFSRVKWGPLEIFLLDARFHRGGVRLGAGQMKWLLESLRTSEAPVKLVVSSSQVLTEPDMGFDNWRSKDEGEYEELMQFVAEEGISGVVYLSGDVHLGYLLHRPGRLRTDKQIGPESWELTSSPLTGSLWEKKILNGNAFPFPKYDASILREINTNNFGVVDVDLDRKGAEVQLWLHGRISEDAFMPLVLQKISLQTLRARRRTKPKLVVTAWPGELMYFFRGTKYARYKMGESHPNGDYPKDIEENWKGLQPGFTSILLTGDNQARFLDGNGYRVVGTKSRAVVGLPQLYLAHAWKGVLGFFQYDLDAAVCWPNGKLYLFRGSKYVRIDVERNEMDEGYPKLISENWTGVWDRDLDSVIVENSQKAIFFKGDEFLEYSIPQGRADPAGPRKIADRWNGVP